MTKLILAFLALFMFTSSPVLAVDLFGDSCKAAPDSAVCLNSKAQTPTTENPINHYIRVGTTIIALITGVAAIILIIVSAFKFVSGGGSPESVKSARSTLISALIGLAIIGMAWAIISFAVDKLIP